MPNFRVSFIVIFLCSLILTGKSNANENLSLKRFPWLSNEVIVAKSKIQTHLLYPGISPGAVIASPQSENPNYFRHWIRDAALVMNSVVDLYLDSPNDREQKFWQNAIWNYVKFSIQNQKRSSNFGEPIFEVNGDLFLGPWGRPQNDGPALRAITLSRWANILLDDGKYNVVKKYLYEPTLPGKSLIKADLEYVSYHWQESSFDLWEEVRGDHFFTRMVQYKALVEGANLAERMHDPFAAQWYRDQAQLLKVEIQKHWTGKIIAATLNWQEGVHYKYSNLDIAVILAVLRGENDIFPVHHSQILATFERLADQFQNQYLINKKYSQLAPSIGRYPEDLYAGTNFDGGNPWVLATLAAAEYCYKLSFQANSLRQARFWLNRGDSFVSRVAFHSHPDGSLAEQIDRNSGFMVSAQDLTWNYAAILTTAKAKEKALIRLPYFK